MRGTSISPIKIDRNWIEKNSKQELVVVLTDLADAFGSIRHSLVHFALEHYGLDQELRTVIKSIYTDLSVSSELNGETVHITQEKGGFQGDCLSPILFNIVINLIVSTRVIVPRHMEPQSTRIPGSRTQLLQMTSHCSPDQKNIWTICWNAWRRHLTNSFQDITRNRVSSRRISNLVRRQSRTYPKDARAKFLAFAWQERDRKWKFEDVIDKIFSLGRVFI